MKCSTFVKCHHSATNATSSCCHRPPHQYNMVPPECSVASFVTQTALFCPHVAGPSNGASHTVFECRLWISFMLSK